MNLVHPHPHPHPPQNIRPLVYGNRTGLGSLPSKQNDHLLYLYFPLYTLAIEVCDVHQFFKYAMHLNFFLFF